MTRNEYNEYRYIKKTWKNADLSKGGHIFTIRTAASAEYKHKLDELYRSWNLHPCCVCVDRHYFDEQERIQYVYNFPYDSVNRWSELYSPAELKRFEDALN